MTIEVSTSVPPPPPTRTAAAKVVIPSGEILGREAQDVYFDYDKNGIFARMAATR